MKTLRLVPILLFSLSSILSFSQKNSASEKMYFPPNSGNEWETKSISSLGWNSAKQQELVDFLAQKNTKSFIILHNGKIVMENYFDGQTASSPWYWASAGKTLTSFTVGIAEQEGFININNKISDYLGTDWTMETSAQEDQITCKNLLTMTSGIEDSNGDGILRENLLYKADAGKRWSYHNVYVKLQDVVSKATGKSWQNYFSTSLKDKIGMSGAWISKNNNEVYWSDARSMARFGLLALNKGNWNGTLILNQKYFHDATKTSQNINLAYGYLWWLNGKSTYYLPMTQMQFSGSLIPSAPKDMFCALGKNDQKIYVVPSKNLVIIRMGKSANNSNFARSDFDEMLWQKIKAMMN
ncbi:serine hydrolase domain-containing protein [Chryseobacterium sp. MP_3.2]|uniref:serine hydrolase domain-containing protein n=1 Tax=Chryseobacterium sp. MP_3.2 TaxID=3071712 RepID=UPI002E09010D|nr:CubicO group peptidase (beta-lactamase class C family) [Chryseobacterium sp. MP_3.2]